MKIDTSVILPVYNGASFIADNLKELDSFLTTAMPSAEILVVEDGSTDDTLAVAQAHATDRIRVISCGRNRGKFGALRIGMESSTQPVRMFIDSDLPFDLSALPYARELVLQGFHVVVGDRTLPESETTVPRSLLRRIASWGFSTMVRQLLTGGVFDTQCGFKAFEGTVGAELFRLLKTESFAGDAELIYLALKYNLAMRRMPVRFIRDTPSSIHLVRDSAVMFQQSLQVPWRWYTGKYESEKLRNFARQQYWV